MSVLNVMKGRFRLSVRFNYAVVPIEIADLLAALQQIGARVGKPPLIPAGSGGTFEPVGGPVAQIGDSIIDVYLERGIIGIEGPTETEIISGFQKLLDILRKDLRLDTDNHTWFTEFVCDLNLKGDKQAIEVLRNAQIPLARAAGKILGESVGIFGLRLGSVEHDPSEPNWFDLRIEPLLRNPQVYFVASVYRNSDMKKVLATAKNFSSKMEKIIGSLEREEGPRTVEVQTVKKSKK